MASWFTRLTGLLAVVCQALPHYRCITCVDCKTATACFLRLPLPRLNFSRQFLNAQERAHLALTLRDTKSVISKLERLLGAIIHTLFIFFYLAIFKVGPGSRLSICRLL